MKWGGVTSIKTSPVILPDPNFRKEASLGLSFTQGKWLLFFFGPEMQELLLKTWCDKGDRPQAWVSFL
jgi:hypothetical protein